MMKRMVAITFLVVMLTVWVLAAGAHLATRFFIDPTLIDLSTAVAALQPEAQEQLIPRLEQLQKLRNSASFYIPCVLFLAGLVATLILSPLLRRSVKRLVVTPKERPVAVEPEISAKEERPIKSVGDDPVDMGACRMLSILQRKGRLIDFLQEDITAYPDAQIGTAVRYIHEDCRNALSEYVTLAPVVSEKEGETVVVPEGFDPSEIRLTGQMTGEPPFEGVLQHSGWKIARISLPEQPKGQKHRVIAPAEVEIGQVE
jgi:hypothetical protein